MSAGMAISNLLLHIMGICGHVWLIHQSCHSDGSAHVRQSPSMLLAPRSYPDKRLLSSPSGHRYNRTRRMFHLAHNTSIVSPMEVTSRHSTEVSFCWMLLNMLSSSLFISQNICDETIAESSNVLGPPYNNSRRRRCWHQFLTLQGDCPWSASGRIHCCCGSGRYLCWGRATLK